MMKKLVILGCVLAWVSCDRISDKSYLRDFYSNQEDNDYLYKQLSVDSIELQNFLSLKNSIDSLELEIQSQLDFLDSIDSNYSPKTIIIGDKMILSNFYNDGINEKEILTLLKKIDIKLTMLDKNYDQRNFNFLPTDTLMMYNKMSPELLSGLFELTISSVRDAEKKALLEKQKK